MFRPGVDYMPHHHRLKAHGRVQIPMIFEDHYAEQIHAALAEETGWELAWQSGAQAQVIERAAYAALDATQRAQFVARVAQESRGRYGYAFENYSMFRHYEDPERAEHLLHQLVDVFHYDPILDFVRRLTGDATIARVRIQATRYLPGHFLRRHDDTGYDEQQRRFAFVFNFTRQWQPDWGGLLQFLDDDRGVVETFVPWFNSLSLFKVPQLHCVSQVAAWAENPRYALTGWFLA